MVKKVRVECAVCMATGYASPSYLPTGLTVKCINCQGRGYVWLFYTPFVMKWPLEQAIKPRRSVARKVRNVSRKM